MEEKERGREEGGGEEEEEGAEFEGFSLKRDRDTPPRIKTALDLFEEGEAKPKLTTGHGDLDALISGIEPGLFYLLHGDDSILSLLAHKLVVNCVLPLVRGGFDGEAIYFNHTNYYTGKTILDPSELGGISKHVGIDPRIVFKRIHVAAAYNEDRQKIIAEKVSELIEQNDAIRLLVVHNLTRFLSESTTTTTKRRSLESREALKSVVGTLWRAASASNVALVATAASGNASRGFIPRPMGGSFLRHVASVILHFRRFRNGGGVQSYKATLVKHPEKHTPQSVVLHVLSVGVPDIVTGESIPTFTQTYESKISWLKKIYVNGLRDIGHRAAFEALSKRSWETQRQALSNLVGVELLDGMNLAASIDTRSEIESARVRGELDDEKIAMMRKEIEGLKRDRRFS